MIVVLLVIAAAVIAYGVWRFRLKHWPYGRCRWCDGSSRNPGSNRDRWGKCRHCGGTGRRLRWGARE